MAIDNLLQDIVWSETNLVSSLYHDSLARIDIHALTILDRCHLKCAQPLYLEEFILMKSLVGHLEHLGDKTLRFCLGKTMLA